MTANLTGKPFYEVLRIRREEAGWTVRDLAERLQSSLREKTGNPKDLGDGTLVPPALEQCERYVRDAEDPKKLVGLARQYMFAKIFGCDLPAFQTTGETLEAAEVRRAAEAAAKKAAAKAAAPEPANS